MKTACLPSRSTLLFLLALILVRRIPQAVAQINIVLPAQRYSRRDPKSALKIEAHVPPELVAAEPERLYEPFDLISEQASRRQSSSVPAETLGQLQDRLARTEAELAEMRLAQSSQNRFAGLSSPETAVQRGPLHSLTSANYSSPPTSATIGERAIETVDQETGPTVSPLRQRWQQIQDPSITTVDQQTRNTGNEPKEWFDRLSIRGYAQFRINEVLSQAPGSAPPDYVGDSSIGDDQSFLIRRARIILSGDVSDRLYVYIQPDFAASVPGSPDANQFGQLRDCYGDIYFDDQKIHRLRVGQSKIPYGWENMQSSSNRIPLDRSDGLDSVGFVQRDLGAIYYYTPDFAQDLFKFVLDKGLKGSGNYGLFGFGFYNGQGGSHREQNDNLHMVARLAVPHQFDSGQVAELGIQGYTGKYVVLTSPINPDGISPAVAPFANKDGYLDQRVAGTLVWYPQPLGFQTEWNVGRGPALDDSQTAVIEKSLTGGYAMMMYRYVSESCGTLFPFVRYHRFRGGYKTIRNAPDSFVSEWDFGLEWQFNPQMELTTQFAFTDRTNTDAQQTGRSYQQFVGSLFRVQFQMNY
jgi:hypothetical protein